MDYRNSFNAVVTSAEIEQVFTADIILLIGILERRQRMWLFWFKLSPEKI
jgi:hypothetical protein